jgi:Cys-rich repeat protein
MPGGFCGACNVDADCGNGQFCVTGACRECKPDGTGCRQGHCDLQTLRCVECLANSQCGRGSSCAPDHTCN